MKSVNFRKVNSVNVYFYRDILYNENRGGLWKNRY